MKTSIWTVLILVAISVGSACGNDGVTGPRDVILPPPASDRPNTSEVASTQEVSDAREPCAGPSEGALVGKGARGADGRECPR